MPYVMAIDQGSGSSRAFVFDVGADGALATVGSASKPVESLFPAERSVEHDAEELFETCYDSAQAALEAAGLVWGDLAGIGITGQTETIVAWDRETGEPAAPAISWRDQRQGAAEVVDALEQGQQQSFTERTGLPIAPTWSAPKIRWMLDGGNEAVASLARRDRLALGDVASWVVHRLSGRAEHVTEPSFASRWGLMDLATRQWDPGLAAMFDIPSAALPEIRPSDALGARVAEGLAAGGAPIIGALGDQQAALYGHGGRRGGQTKITMGTGAFLWANAGPVAPEAFAGLVATCAWAPQDREVAYALEGFLPNAGAVVSWLRSLGLLAHDAWPELDDAALREQTMRALPAIAGLGTPYWAPDATAVFEGMDSGTTPKQIVDACILGAVHLLADAIDSIASAVEPDKILLDGGMSQNDSIAQALADVTGTTIARSSEEATGVGIALLTAHALGLVPPEAGTVEHDATFRPQLSAADREQIREHWQAFVERVL